MTGLRLYLRELAPAPSHFADREIEIPAGTLSIRIRTESGQTLDVTPWGAAGIAVKAPDGIIAQQADCSNRLLIAALAPGAESLTMDGRGPAKVRDAANEGRDQ